MPERFSISIDRIVDLLGLERENAASKAVSYNVKCPFCGDRKFHMNINSEKNSYHCVLCSGDQKGTGALDLYGRVAHGTSLVPGPRGNGKELYKKLCADLKITSPRKQRLSAQSMPAAEWGKGRASDMVLNMTYSEMLKFPHFALIESHRANLLKRGLSETSIVRNLYRSATPDLQWINADKYRSYFAAYEAKASLVGALARTGPLKWVKKNQIIAGFIIADYLIRKGCLLEGVPGFFKLGEKWCLKFEFGILIPTRNREGQIVAIQTRKDKGELRYMTMSSKGLPHGVTEGISRAHFPLGNAPLQEGTKVVLTEGPLKADVALDLMLSSEPCAFIALQGVNNRKELGEILGALKKAGVKKIINGFDMDKTTNPNVASACAAIRKMATTYDISVSVLFWDEKYARKKAEELQALCKKNNLPCAAGSNCFAAVCIAAHTLHDAGISHSISYRDGKETKSYWSGKTKGIDDWLLYQKHGRK